MNIVGGILVDQREWSQKNINVKLLTIYWGQVGGIKEKPVYKSFTYFYNSCKVLIISQIINLIQAFGVLALK